MNIQDLKHYLLTENKILQPKQYSKQTKKKQQKKSHNTTKPLQEKEKNISKQPK